MEDGKVGKGFKLINMVHGLGQGWGEVLKRLQLVHCEVMEGEDKWELGRDSRIARDDGLRQLRKTGALEMHQFIGCHDGLDDFLISFRSQPRARVALGTVPLLKDLLSLDVTREGDEKVNRPTDVLNQRRFVGD